MKHIFDVEIATEHGINAAILFENICYWVKQNEANEINFFDGDYWTYNSHKAFGELFPYMSKRQIETALSKLIESGMIKTGNYNRLAYDRTLWYALTQKGKCISHFGVMENNNMGNGRPQNVTPIPNINTDINPNNKQHCNNNKADKPPRTRFVPPSLEDVQSYCRERQNDVDAQRFIDYYTSNGWKVGKNSMKDWKAAVRNWERSDTAKPASKQQDKPSSTGNQFFDLIESGVFE